MLAIAEVHKYMEEEGLTCPDCRTKAIQQDGNPEYMYTGGEIRVKTVCLNCGAEFIEHWKLDKVTRLDRS